MQTQKPMPAGRWATPQHATPQQQARTRRAALVLAMLVAFAALAGVQRRARAAEPHGDLRIDATGFTSSQGHARAKLFRKGENVLGPAKLQATTTIHAGLASFTFSDLPVGNYALVVFHDHNDNHKIDHSFLGLPVEALGFSNGFVPGLFAGMPTFEKLKFAFSATTGKLRVNVK